jgi:hypothetical protein
VRSVGAILAVSVLLGGAGCGGGSDSGGGRAKSAPSHPHHSKDPVDFDPGFTLPGGTVGVTSGCLACHTIDKNNGAGPPHQHMAAAG